MSGAVADVSGKADILVSDEIADQEFGTPDFTQLDKLATTAYTDAQKYAAESFDAANAALADLLAAAAKLAIAPIDIGQIVVDDVLPPIKAFATKDFAYSPTLGFGYQKTDADYTSPELTHLIAALDTWVRGTATALPPEIEFANWNRQREANADQADKKYFDAARTAAARGYSKAPGVLAIEMTAIAAEEQNANAAAARDIAVKQADLEQTNRQLAIRQASRTHAMLITYLRDKLQRALDAAEAIMRGGLEAFGNEVRSYGAVAGYAGAQAGASAQLDRAAVDVRIAKANLTEESLRQTAERDLQRVIVEIEALRGAAATVAQLTSSALAAINLSGGISASSSWSMGVSDSRSRSTSASISSQSAQQFNYTP